MISRFKISEANSPDRQHLGKSLLSGTSQAPRLLAPDIDSDDHDVDSNGNDQDHDVKGQDVDDHMMMV